MAGSSISIGVTRDSRRMCLSNEAISRPLFIWVGHDYGNLGVDAKMSHKKLRVWQMARDLSVKIHTVTMTQLPKHEMYEEGPQLRRSIKSVRSNIVEGYGRRMYRQDFVRFMVMAHASCDETLDHLDTLHESGSLADESLFNDVHARVEELGKALGGCVRSVQSQHVSVRADSFSHDPDS